MGVNTNIIDMAKKAVGRPKGQLNDRLLQMRVSEEFLELIDDWRGKQRPIPGRTEAIRRLIESALQRGK